MPVRRPHSNGRTVIGRFPSLTMRRMVAYESLVELDYLYVIDQDRAVSSYEEQPFHIPSTHEGQAHRYTPDFRVEEAGRTIVVECKPARYVDTDENRRTFTHARAWCADRGFTFRVVTAEHIRSGWRLPNVRLLTQFARHTVDPDTEGRVIGLLAMADGSRSLTIGLLALALSPSAPQQHIVALLHLAYHHRIVVSLDDGPLDGDSPVHLPYPARLAAGGSRHS